VPAALGKAYNALGKGFAECRTWQSLQDKKKVSAKPLSSAWHLVKFKKKSWKNSNFFLPWRPLPASACPFLYLFMPIPLFVSVAFSSGFFLCDSIFVLPFYSPFLIFFIIRFSFWAFWLRMFLRSDGVFVFAIYIYSVSLSLFLYLSILSIYT
jgi:hypothetical protein